MTPPAHPEDRSAQSPWLRVDLPLTEYEDALALQREIVAARKERRLDRDVVLLLEHPPVFTLGRNGGRENLTITEAFLSERSIRVVQIERGGNITYHGPGQLVAYPVLNLTALRLPVKDYVTGLERVMAAVANDQGIPALGDEKNRGIWVDGRKLGSIGITVTQGISFHGLALNVNTDLEPFTWINPCGLQDVRMTSMEAELGREIDMEAVRKAMARHLTGMLGREGIPATIEDLRKRMGSTPNA